MSSLPSLPVAYADEKEEAKRMQWLLNLPTRTKLMLGFGFMFFLLLGAVVSAYFGIATLRNTFNTLLSGEVSFSIDLRSLRANQNGVRANLLMIMAEADADQGPLREDTQTRMDSMDTLMIHLLSARPR